MRYEPERANTEENKEKRAQFCRQFLHYQGQGRPIIFLDETNFNLHISRKFGRSKQGERCSVLVSGSKGANIHVIGCISSLGVVHIEVRRGSFTTDLAN